jgi:hypothetical protein
VQGEYGGESTAKNDRPKAIEPLAPVLDRLAG